MQKQVRHTIDMYGMLEKGDRVGIGVSGGPDSVALVQCFAALRLEYDLWMMIIHFNHGIRGDESDRDEAFVMNLAENYGIPVVSEKVSIPAIRRRSGGSLEELCRSERYRYFERIVREWALDKIVLGHTLEDQAETVVMNFLRGSGSRGLRGIMPVRDKMYIRPLIETSKHDIMDFLEATGAAYVTDSSNSDDSYLRNRIRHQLIPELKARYNPRVVEHAARTASIMKSENDFIQHAVNEVIAQWNLDRHSEEISISIPALTVLHDALQMRIIKELLESRTDIQGGITHRHVMAVMGLVKGDRPNAMLNLPLGIVVRRGYHELSMTRGTPRTQNILRQKGDKWKINDYHYEVSIPGTVYVEEIGVGMSFEFVDKAGIKEENSNAAYIDFETVALPLIVRNMRPGDTIRPLGLRGTKKVKSVFIDAKIPRIERSKIPLLVDAESVLWIAGMRVHEKSEVTDRTRKVLKAEIV